MYADKCNNVVEIFNIRLTMIEKKYTMFIKDKKEQRNEKYIKFKT